MSGTQMEEARCKRCCAVLEDYESGFCAVCEITLQQEGEEAFAEDMNELYGEGGW